MTLTTNVRLVYSLCTCVRAISPTCTPVHCNIGGTGQVLDISVAETTTTPQGAFAVLPVSTGFVLSLVRKEWAGPEIAFENPVSMASVLHLWLRVTQNQ